MRGADVAGHGLRSLVRWVCRGFEPRACFERVSGPRPSSLVPILPWGMQLAVACGNPPQDGDRQPGSVDRSRFWCVWSRARGTRQESAQGARAAG